MPGTQLHDNESAALLEPIKYPISKWHPHLRSYPNDVLKPFLNYEHLSLQATFFETPCITYLNYNQDLLSPNKDAHLNNPAVDKVWEHSFELLLSDTTSTRSGHVGSVVNTAVNSVANSVARGQARVGSVL